MGILDDAIREHLELKRQHGAPDDEVAALEKDAFGPAERPGDAAPDPEAEAPTEFMAQPDLDQAPLAAEPLERTPRGEPDELHDQPDDLEEPGEPPATAEEREAEAEAEAGEAEEHEAAEEPSPAAEQELPPPEIAAEGPSTEEREAIAEHPTELYDVEGEIAAEAPSDDDLADEERGEPRLGAGEPLAEPDEGEIEISSTAQREPEYDDDYEDDFWDEKRLSDELDQALEGPAEAEPEVSVEETGREEGEEADREEEPPAASEGTKGSDDVLDKTPEFLEGSPEDDELWFEQKPPKDFDFDD